MRLTKLLNYYYSKKKPKLIRISINTIVQVTTIKHNGKKKKMYLKKTNAFCAGIISKVAKNHHPPSTSCV